MDHIAQLMSIGIPTLAVLVGVLVNNSRLTDLRVDLRSYMDARFTAQEQVFTERLRRFEEVIGARLTRIEQELKLR
jgi:hypothetical protein